MMLSLNDRAVALADRLAADAEALQVGVTTLPNGTRPWWSTAASAISRCTSSPTAEAATSAFPTTATPTPASASAAPSAPGSAP